MKHARWVFFSLFLCLWTAATAEVLRITQAHAVLTPNQGAAHEVSLTLPHRWDQSFPGQAGRASYRFELPASPDPNPRALYLPRVGNQFEIWLDGQRIHRGGQLGDARTDHAKAPVLVVLPEPHRAGGQPATPVLVHVSAQASRWGGLSAPWVGPVDEVRERYLSRYRERQYGALVICAVLLLLALMAAGFWWSQRERLYLVFCVGSAAGVLRIGDRLIEHTLLPWPLWGAVSASALLVHLIMAIYFALMLVNRHHWLESRWVRVLFGFDMALIAAAFGLGWPMGWTLALASMLALDVYALMLLVQAAWRERSGQAIAALLAAIVLIGAGMRDWWVVRVMGDGTGTASILEQTTVLYALLMGAVLVQRFAREAREHRLLLATLDERVRQRETELAARDSELREEQTRQAALQERQRLMRDIHDGVGAHLSGLLSLIEHGTTAPAVLREHAHTALDELRMAVDALQPVHGDLATVLATLRYRLQPRLDAAGIAIDWRVDALPAVDGLSPAVVLQLQRILQEAFTNAMRHAQASLLQVRAYREEGPPESLVLSVGDSGRGLAPTQTDTARGLGLASMRSRAEALGAQLQIGASELGGAEVRLRIPLHAWDARAPG